MEQKLYESKSYNYAPATTACSLITIRGKLYCVLKKCYFRAIGAACPPEAPTNWEEQADFLVKTWTEKPEEWI